MSAKGRKKRSASETNGLKKKEKKAEKKQKKAKTSQAENAGPALTAGKHLHAAELTAAEAFLNVPPRTVPPARSQTAQQQASAQQKTSDSEAHTPLPDFEKLAVNMAEFMGHGGRLFSSYLHPATQAGRQQELGEDVAGVVRTLGRVAEHWMKDPARTLEAQRMLSTDFMSLWAQTLRRFSGEAEAPVVPPDPTDKRFAAPEWNANPFFDFLRQAHAILTHWTDDLALRAEGLDDHTRDKARFYIRQISGALAPSNFIMTNPEILRETFASNAENLLRGLGHFAEDVEAGHGTLKIRQTDATKFELGVNVAATPGKVIFRNALIELIQYDASTKDVLQRPLLIVPPWINKFYILDLNAEKSFVRYAVSEGHTVFMMSWVNPDERHRDKDWDAYVNEGIYAALDAIEAATGEREVNAIGYCVGGTLLAATLAAMAQNEDQRIKSATFFAAQTDFAKAGDLSVFIDEEQIAALELKMKETGYLEGSKMATAFNMLRPNDLIWSYVVNNYLKGKTPAAFDLLAWNSDSTRIPAANHSFYLRACYLENRLSKGAMVINGRKVSLHDVTIPIYSLAAKEDHIAPSESVWRGASYFGGDVRFVCAGSGHIAGVINPPGKIKYQYWSGGPIQGALEDWFKAAQETPGSWWPDWSQWLRALSSDTVPARVPGDGELKPLCDAPGDYVRVTS